jgi:hypothetical protein
MDHNCNQEVIEKLFFKQIKELTTKTMAQSYDYQFSDGWMQA